MGETVAKTFDELSPEESQRRLGLIVDKIDTDKVKWINGFIKHLLFHNLLYLITLRSSACLYVLNLIIVYSLKGMLIVVEYHCLKIYSCTSLVTKTIFSYVIGNSRLFNLENRN